MKSFNLKRKSWHYRIAASGGATSLIGTVNFCSYLKYFIKGLIGLLALTTVVGAVLFVCGHLVYTTGQCLFTTKCVLGPIDQMALVWVGLGVFVTVLVCHCIARDKRKLRARISVGHGQDPGFLVLAYRAIKDKVCFNIKFED